MQENTLMPKYEKNKKPVRRRKPSRPIDGINHRLIREQAAKAAEALAVVPVAIPADSEAPTRSELEAKATELSIRFDGRTKDKKLGQLIQDRLTGE